MKFKKYINYIIFLLNIEFIGHLFFSLVYKLDLLLSNIMTSRRIIALKRVSNDLKELAQCPLEGIGIAQIIDNPMEYVINMELMMGPYVGYKLQLLLTISEEYPIKPPKVLIYPDQLLDSCYHHHIFLDSKGFKRFCINLLDNDFHMDTNEQYTGWNPAYTISTILLQVQNFISNPDFPSENPIEEKRVDNLIKSMDKYQRTFVLCEEGGKTSTVTHTWKNPYPKMHYSSNQMVLDLEQSSKAQAIKENLTCYILRDNYVDNPDILLGYPIVQIKSPYGLDKIEVYPIPQLLTYEAFKLQSSQNPTNQNSIGSLYSGESSIKAANNQYFNNWFPIYVNEDHFYKNREKIINSLKVIKNEAEFRPQQIFDILPIILNKMIIGMFNGKSIFSSSFITCYFHYVLLFKKLCQEYKDEYEKYLNKKLSLIRMNDYQANKKIIPDIGDFLMLIFLGNNNMAKPEIENVKKALIEEFLNRQIFWIFYGPECYQTMKSKVLKCSISLNDEMYLERFGSDPNFKMNYLDVFNKELHRQNIFNRIIDIISNDNNFIRLYNKDYRWAKSQAEKGIKRSFKQLFNQCSQWSRSRIKEVILANLHFQDFFEEDENQMKNWLYDSYRVSDMLKVCKEDNESLKEVLKYAYESQRGNQLLLITFYAFKKIEEQGFIEELKKNFGIFFQVDEFVDGLKLKLNEIKTYKSLYEYIGYEFGKDKTELELIVEGYERAKLRRYIRDPNEPVRMSIPSSRFNLRRPRSRRRGFGLGLGSRFGY